MQDLNVIDRFMDAFIRYIDSGFGLLGPDVAFLTTTLIGIDITLAGLFWALGGEQDVIGRFLKKILYIGAFALILNSFSTLADIIFRSFAQAGLTAGGGTLSAEDLLRPGRVAATGFSAAWPLLDQASSMMGFISFFAGIGEKTVSVQVTSVVRASDRSFQIKWTETAFERGVRTGTSNWTGILTVRRKPPTSAETLRRNPLGIYVDAIDWSRELDLAPAPSPAPAPPPNLPLGSPLDPGLGGQPIQTVPENQQ